MLSRLRGLFERTAAARPVLLAFLVAVGAALIIVPLSMPFYLDSSANFWENIVAEMHGVLFDLLLIGWFLFWLNKIAERRIRYNRYQEEIEDYLGWHSNEATLRIVGNIRRLNRGGVTSGFRLTEAHLEGAKLGGVQMDKTDLWGAHLELASLREGQLNESNLAGANLEGADLERSSLNRSDLRGANLNEADLERAALAGADLRGASLVGADLQYADLHGSNLQRCKLIGANLRAANLGEADLTGASLEGAHARGANLQGATLIDVDMTGADLVGTDLTGVTLPDNDEEVLAMFERAKSLFGIELEPGLLSRLQETLPTAFTAARSEASEAAGGFNGSAQAPSTELEGTP